MSGNPFDLLPLFNNLTPAQVDLLRPLFVQCDYFPGTVIFEQGDPAEFIYLVYHGEVVIQYTPEDGPPITVTRVRPGGLVGWSALIGRSAYTSAVVCSTYSQLLRLRGGDLQKLCEQHPETGLLVLDRLADMIAERLRSTHPEVVALLEDGLRTNAKCLGG